LATIKVERSRVRNTYKIDIAPENIQLARAAHDRVADMFTEEVNGYRPWASKTYEQMANNITLFDNDVGLRYEVVLIVPGATGIRSCESN
jgi:hypothetical protein